jgi:tyrosyl-tRNA synthetase
MNVLAHLRERGLIDSLTSDELAERVCKPITLYLGFDPTADSLHLGHWLGIVLLIWFQKFGHTPIILIGGATGRIGDPSGKSIERPLLLEEELEANISALRIQFSQIAPGIEIVDNYSWLANWSLVDFLRDIGKQFRVGNMLAKESVKARLHSEEGLSFTEFSYQILQGYDFFHLLTTRNVELQLGGSDQWGNITAGLDVIRKLGKRGAYGLTFPLLTRSDGKKFGKSEGNVIWLDSRKCNPYQFYQYLLKIPDEDVILMLRRLTFLPLEKIAALAQEMKGSAYTPHTAQRLLATELTRLIHGEEKLQHALSMTESVAPGGETVLTKERLEALSGEIPHLVLSIGEFVDTKVVELLVRLGLAESKGAAHRLIQNGGVYLNNEKLEDPYRKIQLADRIAHRFVLLSAGKKKKGIVESAEEREGLS